MMSPAHDRRALVEVCTVPVLLVFKWPHVHRPNATQNRANTQRRVYKYGAPRLMQLQRPEPWPLSPLFHFPLFSDALPQV